MTTFEHAMVGVNGALACGLHRRFGWQIVAMSGLAAVSPDWDCATLLFGMSSFDRWHRVLGHNLLVAGLLGALIGWTVFRFDLATKVANWICRTLRIEQPRLESLAESRSNSTCVMWVLVGTAAAYSHLPADLVVSGTATLGDWHLQLLWPFSDKQFIYPLIYWGDPGVAIIFAAGMFALVRWPRRVQLTAFATLGLVTAYMFVR